MDNEEDYKRTSSEQKFLEDSKEYLNNTKKKKREN